MNISSILLWGLLLPTILYNGSALHWLAIIVSAFFAIYLRHRLVAFMTVLSAITPYFPVFSGLILWYPVIINLLLIFIFAKSLYEPESFIEKLAEKTSKDPLTDRARLYCRRLTLAWTVFLLFNMLVASYTVLFCSPEMWALYNGVISYVIIAIFFAAELGYRKFFLCK